MFARFACFLLAKLLFQRNRRAGNCTGTINTMKKVVAAFVAISVALIAFFAGWLAAKGPAVAVELMTKDSGLKAQW